MQLLKSLKARLFASQLRRPGFLFGKKVGEQMNKANAFLYDFTLNEMNVKDGDRILEIGFGNGKMFPEVFSKANNLSVTGIDYSTEMLRQAVKYNKEKIESGQLKLVSGNSYSIPYPDNHFDKVFCINVIYFWDKPQDHLKEILRILKPGGNFFATIRSKKSMLAAPFTKWGFNIYETHEWVSKFSESGFINVSTTDITEPEVIRHGKKIYFQSHCIIAQKPDS